MNVWIAAGRMARSTALCLAAACLAGARAECQVATVSTFETVLMPASPEAGGMALSARSEFALHELNLRRATQSRLDVMPIATSQTFAAPPDLAAPGAICGLGAMPSPRFLPSRTLVGRKAFWPLIARAECRFGLPKGLMDSVVLAESGYDPSVVSPAGAAGLTQLMPATALQLGVADRFDPDANVLAGARYLRQLLDSFGGNVRLALAAYSAGPAAVRHVRGIPINGETPDYVRRVLGYWTAPGIGPMSPALPARQFAQMLGFSPSVTN